MTQLLTQSAKSPRLKKAKAFILASFIAGAMVVPLFLPAQKAKAAGKEFGSGENANALLGTWLVQVALDPTTLPPGGTLNFTEIDTYGVGGGYVASNSGPGAGGPPAQGNWVKPGHNQFSLPALRLGFDTTHVYTGISKIRAVLTLNAAGDEFTAVSQIDIILPNGTVLPFHPAAIAHATRVAI